MATASFDLGLDRHIAELRSKLVAEHDAVLGLLLQELRREVSTLHQEQTVKHLEPNGMTPQNSAHELYSIYQKPVISGHELPPSLCTNSSVGSTGLIMPPPAIISPSPPSEHPVKLVAGEQVEDQKNPIKQPAPVLPTSTEAKSEARSDLEHSPRSFSIAIPGCMQTEVTKKTKTFDAFPSCLEEECETNPCKRHDSSDSRATEGLKSQSQALASSAGLSLALKGRQTTNSNATYRSNKSHLSRSGSKSESFMEVLSQMFAGTHSGRESQNSKLRSVIRMQQALFSPRPSDCKSSSISPCLRGHFPFHGSPKHAGHLNALHPVNNTMRVSQRGHQVDQFGILSPRPSAGGLLSVFPEHDHSAASLRSSVTSCCSVESRFYNDHGIDPSIKPNRKEKPHREAQKSYQQASRNKTAKSPVGLSLIADVSVYDEFHFETLPIWDKSDNVPIMSALTTAGSADDYDDSDSDNEANDQAAIDSKCERCLVRFMVMPMSKKRMLWDFFGCLFIAYDFVITPLQFFDPPPSKAIDTINWIVRVFWSLDLPLSFMTAHSLPVGTIERRPAKVWARYARTWMLCDVAIIAVDWVDLAMQSEGLGAARIGKTFKITRLLRMVRLVRLVKMIKMPDVFTAFTYHLHSERLVIVIGIIKIMIFLIAVTHLIACGWFGMGSLGDPESWITENRMESARLEYKYFTSFHWSMTQFTGSMEVFPHNFGERFYTVITLLFGFIMSASVVSTITSSMTRLQIVSASETTQAATLNQYLLDNGISAKVALRVQRNAVYMVSQEKRNTPESSIELLQFVSEPLRIELHYEIHCPVLTWYPFFRLYNEYNRSGMKRICHSTVKTLSLSRGDVLFSAGELPPLPVMYFVCAGKLQYQRQGHCSESVYSGSHACQSVLWTIWIHLGHLRAKAESNLLLLDATQFQATAVQYQTGECFPKKFAREFVQELNKSKKVSLTDLEDIGFNVEDVCDKVFKLKRTATVNLEAA